MSSRAGRTELPMLVPLPISVPVPIPIAIAMVILFLGLAACLYEMEMLNPTKAKLAGLGVRSSSDGLVFLFWILRCSPGSLRNLISFRVRLVR